jgi:hypothetical protein
MLAGVLLLSSGAAGGTAAAATPSCSPGPQLNCVALPLDFTAVNDCTGDLVAITGVYHILAQTTVNKDGTITTLAYTNYQDSLGVAVPSLTKYQANLTDHQFQRTDPISPALDFNIDDNFELISNAPTPNMLVHFRFHLNIDESGFPTISIRGTDARCAG